MSCISHSLNSVDYPSQVWRESAAYPGVRFAARQISLGGRIELTRMIQEIIHKNEFLKAGEVLEQAQASLADLLARKVYLEWGITKIEGLLIDGAAASVSSLIALGPEHLCEEMVAAIRSDLTLSPNESKNF